MQIKQFSQIVSELVITYLFVNVFMFVINWL